jgi:hypothetical protein
MNLNTHATPIVPDHQFHIVGPAYARLPTAVEPQAHIDNYDSWIDIAVPLPESRNRGAAGIRGLGKPGDGLYDGKSGLPEGESDSRLCT